MYVCIIHCTQSTEDIKYRTPLKKRFVFLALDEEINGRFSPSAELIIQLSHYDEGGEVTHWKFVITEKTEIFKQEEKKISNSQTYRKEELGFEMMVRHI